jgi:hypothetical protein
VTLPADWPEQRETLRHIATHILARARHGATGRFSLEPTIGGFGTPTFTTAADTFRRLRITTADRACLIDEQIAPEGATTQYVALFDTSLTALADAIGVELDASFSVGDDTPELGDPDRPISVDPSVISIIGEWYALGSIAIDRSVTAPTARAPSVARVWPEHFDLGTDVEVAPGRRCNLGASPGDATFPDPYLYVGPWGAERPGDSGYWNAPFGAVLAHSEVVTSDDPLRTATAFFHDGIRRLGA